MKDNPTLLVAGRYVGRGTRVVLTLRDGKKVVGDVLAITTSAIGIDRQSGESIIASFLELEMLAADLIGSDDLVAQIETDYCLPEALRGWVKIESIKTWELVEKEDLPLFLGMKFQWKRFRDELKAL